MPHDNDPLTQASTRLQALAQHPPRRSAAMSLRTLLPDIEAAKQAGASSADILAELAAAGIPIAPRTFAKTLSRIRQERRAFLPTASPSTPPSTVAVVQATPAPVATSASAKPPRTPSSDPRGRMGRTAMG
ncbi:hypothetical protein [Thiocystis minor]|uniref:hypothetical protein n=1 Tax=Thiocystis minor TaxID=61597 RepID=UPI0019128E87|nr:hypothetical protein [Thiocystis minor]